MRSLHYYNGNMQAGLGTGLIVIITFFGVFLSLYLMMTFQALKQDNHPSDSANEQLVTGTKPIALKVVEG
jgi:hypothetical protein